MKVEITKLDHYGRGVSRLNNKIVFIENALPNEIVEIEIIKEHKKYIEAKTTKIIKPSEDRITPPCPYYEKCGGCNLEHISFLKENEFKEEKVKEIIEKFAKTNKNIIKDIVYDESYHYRNKVTLHQINNKLGFYEKKTNNIIPIKECLLLNKELNKYLKNIKSKNNEIILKIGNKTNEILDSTKNIKNIISYIGSKKYRLSEKSFFQVNNVITEKLYNNIKDEIIKNNSKNVLDLYCGTGTIGIYISDNVNKVLGIESCKEAIEDANYNKKLNNCNNITFKLGKVEDLTKDLTKDYDTVIVDPPRNGLDKKVTNKLLEILPKTIIYVSCDPITLARDLSILKGKYNIKYIRPYNMFPRTYHVENICILNKKLMSKDDK